MTETAETIHGNASAFVGKTPPPHVPLDARALMVHWAHWGVVNAEHFVYDEHARRSMMLGLRPGDLSKPIHADCSQFYASCGHWSGVPGFTDTDWTGTLLEKGHLLLDRTSWKPADCVIFGGGTGDHAAMLTERDGTADWWIVGFGHQGAPDRGTLSGTIAWFEQNRMPGVRVLSFTP